MNEPERPSLEHTVGYRRRPLGASQRLTFGLPSSPSPSTKRSKSKSQAVCAAETIHGRTKEKSNRVGRWSQAERQRRVLISSIMQGSRPLMQASEHTIGLIGNTTLSAYARPKSASFGYRRESTPARAAPEGPLVRPPQRNSPSKGAAQRPMSQPSGQMLQVLRGAHQQTIWKDSRAAQQRRSSATASSMLEATNGSRERVLPRHRSVQRDASGCSPPKKRTSQGTDRRTKRQSRQRRSNRAVAKQPAQRTERRYQPGTRRALSASSKSATSTGAHKGLPSTPRISGLARRSDPRPIQQTRQVQHSLLGIGLLRSHQSIEHLVQASSGRSSRSRRRGQHSLHGSKLACTRGTGTADFATRRAPSRQSPPEVRTALPRIQTAGAASLESARHGRRRQHPQLMPGQPSNGRHRGRSRARPRAHRQLGLLESPLLQDPRLVAGRKPSSAMEGQHQASERIQSSKRARAKASKRRQSMVAQAGDSRWIQPVLPGLLGAHTPVGSRPGTSRLGRLPRFEGLRADHAGLSDQEGRSPGQWLQGEPPVPQLAIPSSPVSTTTSFAEITANALRNINHMRMVTAASIRSPHDSPFGSTPGAAFSRAHLFLRSVSGPIGSHARAGYSHGISSELPRTRQPFARGHLPQDMGSRSAVLPAQAQAKQSPSWTSLGQGGGTYLERPLTPTLAERKRPQTASAYKPIQPTAAGGLSGQRRHGSGRSPKGRSHSAHSESLNAAARQALVSIASRSSMGSGLGEFGSEGQVLSHGSRGAGSVRAVSPGSPLAGMLWPVGGVDGLRQENSGEEAASAAIGNACTPNTPRPVPPKAAFDPGCEF